MIPAIISTLGYVAANIPSFVALGADVMAMFDAAKALVTSDTGSTPTQRATALAEIEGMQGQIADRLEELRQTAP